MNMKKFGDFVKLNEQEVQLQQAQSQPEQPQVQQTNVVNVNTSASTEQTAENGSIIKFVNKLFESRQMAHVYHLKIESYAKHVALQAYYDGILELVDEFVEVWQGQFQLLDGYDMILNEVKEEDPIKYFEELVNYIKAEKSKVVNAEDTHLLNIVDEMVALMYKTLYKLKHLK